MHIIRKWISTDGLPHAIERCLLVILGIALIHMREDFTRYVHIIVGAAMLILCSGMLAEAILEKSYRNMHDRKLPTSLVGLVLGVMILLHEKNSIPFIAVAWGINGLSSGITELGHAVYRIAHHEKSLYHLIHGLIEIVLSVMLVFDPVEKIGEHIMILGLEMLVFAVSTREKDEAAHG